MIPGKGRVPTKTAGLGTQPLNPLPQVQASHMQPLTMYLALCWLQGGLAVFQKQPHPSGSIQAVAGIKATHRAGGQIQTIRAVRSGQGRPLLCWPLGLFAAKFSLKGQAGSNFRFANPMPTPAPGCPRLPSPKTSNSHLPNLNIPGRPLHFQRNRALLPELLLCSPPPPPPCLCPLFSWESLLQPLKEDPP